MIDRFVVIKRRQRVPQFCAFWRIGLEPDRLTKWRQRHRPPSAARPCRVLSRRPDQARCERAPEMIHRCVGLPPDPAGRSRGCSARQQSRAAAQRVRRLAPRRRRCPCAQSRAVLLCAGVTASSAIGASIVVGRLVSPALLPPGRRGVCSRSPPASDSGQDQPVGRWRSPRPPQPPGANARIELLRSIQEGARLLSNNTEGTDEGKRYART